MLFKLIFLTKSLGSQIRDPTVPPVVFETSTAGKMIISLSMNITMNQLGGASVIAKFHS